MLDIVRAGGLAGFDSLVRSLGGSPSLILRRAGLRVDDLADPDRYLPYRNVLLAIEEAATELKSPDFGLRLSAVQDVNILGTLALAIQSAPTMREGMLLGAKNMHFHTPGIGFKDFRSDDGRTECLEFFFRFPQAPIAPQAVEHVVGHLCNLVALLSDRSIRPVGIYFRHGKIGSSEQYIQHLGQLPRFNAAFDGISVDPLEWRRPLQTRNAVLQTFVERFLLGIRPSQDHPIADQVREVLCNLTRIGPVDLRDVSRVLELHPRTLQRRLRADGVAFEDLRDAARRTLAIELLAQPHVSLAHIAQLLGFADQSVLTRACQRWFGNTPKRMRSSRATGSPPT
jgi:AraC-like DNA-binding protein